MFQVLIINDDPDAINLMKEALDCEPLGMQVQVLVAAGADEAAHQIKTTTAAVDLVFMAMGGDELDSSADLLPRLSPLVPHALTIAVVDKLTPPLVRLLQQGVVEDFITTPIQGDELVLRVHRLLSHRMVRGELDWLQALSSVSESIHTVNSVGELAQAVIDGVHHLGFSRARFYRLLDPTGDDPVVKCLAESGLGLLDRKIVIEVPISRTDFVQDVWRTEEVCFFTGDDPRPGFLRALNVIPDFEPPSGEWAGMPVKRQVRCEAVILMDNGKEESRITPAQRRHLPLLADQLSAAYVRAADNERRLLRERAASIAQDLTTILRANDRDDLQPFCDAFLELVVPGRPQANLMLAIRYDDEWICEWVLSTSGKVIAENRWRPADEQVMAPFVIGEHRRPLFLPAGTAAFRQEHGLGLIHAGREAHSWMAAPFYNAGRIAGALIVEHDDIEHAFDRDDFALLCALSEELGGHLYAAWLDRQRKELMERLALVQRASEDIMLLAEQSEDWLWHATLTLATAHFGFSFDRALLLLQNTQGTELVGRMAIGHFRWEDAERDWKGVEHLRQQVRRDLWLGNNSGQAEAYLHWNRYLAELRDGQHQQHPTPLQDALSDGPHRPAYQLRDEDNVLTRVMRSGRPETIAHDRLDAELPATIYEFLYAGPAGNNYQPTRCAVVPVAAKDQSIGLLLLDNIWRKEPQQLGSVDYIDTLTNQAAVLYKNRILDKRWTQLDDFRYTVLNRISEQPQAETLSQICDRIREYFGADHVAIYPVRQQGASYVYEDFARAGSAGMFRPSGKRQYVILKPLDGHVVRFQQIRVIEDTTGFRLHSFVSQMGIRSMLVAPVIGARTKATRAVMYVDFKTPRVFDLQDIQMAKEFSALAATALRYHRQLDARGRERGELERAAQTLGRLLQRSSDVTLRSERDIVRIILAETMELLNQPDINLMVAMRGWTRTTPNENVREIRREYTFADGQNVHESAEEDVGRGVRGLVLHNGRSEYIRDTRQIEPRLAKLHHETAPEVRSKIYIPIRTQAEPEAIGVLVAESNKVDGFPPVQQGNLERIAAASCLLFTHLRRQLLMREYAKAASEIPKPTRLQDTLEMIGAMIHQAIPDIDIVTIWHRKSTTEPNIMVCGLATGPAHGETGRVELLDHRPLLRRTLEGEEHETYEEDAQNEDQYTQSFARRYLVQARASQKIMLEDDAFGVLFLSYCHPHRFSEDEKTIFNLLASTIAAALNDARMIAEIEDKQHQAERQRLRFATALSMAQKLGSTLDTDGIINMALGILKQANYFPDTAAAILLYNPYENTLEFVPGIRDHYVITNGEFAQHTTIPVDGKSIVSAVAREALEQQKKVVWRTNDVRACRNHYLELRQETRSQLTIALYNPDQKRLIGILLMESTRYNAFDDDAEELARLVATDVRIAIERGRQNEELMKTRQVTARWAGGSRAAHDIRHEIAIIASSCHMIQHTNPASHTKHLDTIRGSIRRLRGLASYPDEYDQREEIDLPAVLSIWLRDGLALHGQGIEPVITFAVTTFGTRTAIVSRPRRLGEVMEHLIRNSCEQFRLMPKSTHGHRLTINITGDPTRDHVEIVYMDSGPGVPVDQESQVFSSRPTPVPANGRGYGLLHAEYILRNELGGVIYYVRKSSDKRQYGARFVIRLPWVSPSEEDEVIS